MRKKKAGRREDKNTKIIISILFLLVIFSTILFSIILYPWLPSKIPSHWNTKGEVDDYMNKYTFFLMILGIECGFFILYLLIPRIDPLARNIKDFRKEYDGLFSLLFAFVFYLYCITMLWSIGIRVPIKIVPILVGILFLYIGMVLPRIKKNWFIGIRTPWTLSSDYVWRKTHKLGGLIFSIIGILFILTAIIDLSFTLVIILTIVLICIPIIYSLVLYKGNKK